MKMLATVVEKNSPRLMKKSCLASCGSSLKAKRRFVHCEPKLGLPIVFPVRMWAATKVNARAFIVTDEKQGIDGYE
jgi:hypothetical protein